MMRMLNSPEAALITQRSLPMMTLDCSTKMTGGMSMSFKTKMASLASYDKGSIELNDDLSTTPFPTSSKSAASQNPMNG